MKRPPVIKQDSHENLEIVWPNTSIDQPTLADLIETAKKHFPDTPSDKIGVLAGIMRLTLKKGHNIN